MLKNDSRTTGVTGDMASMEFPDEKRVSDHVAAPHLHENRSHTLNPYSQIILPPEPSFPDHPEDTYFILGIWSLKL